MPRYTREKITEVLNTYWPITDKTQAHSRLFFNHPNSFVFLLKKRGVSKIPLLGHTYLAFEDNVWHPGAPNDPIIQPKFVNESGVSMLLEKSDTWPEMCKFDASEIISEMRRIGMDLCVVL